MTATTHPTTPAADALDPVAQTLACLEDLLCRYAAQAETVAQLRRRLADLHDERTLREAQAQLGVDGRNEAERAARLRLRLAADADYQRCHEAEKSARVDIARAEAAVYITRVRVHACLALLRLAGDAAFPPADGADAAVPALPEEDPS